VGEPEPATILGAGTIVLATLFAARIALRMMARGAVTAPRSSSGAAPAAGVSEAPDVPGVLALPPLIFLAFLMAATVLELLVPLQLLGAHPLARYLTGAALAACGVIMIGMGTRRFMAAGTNIPPTLPTTALVVDGIYRRTRNPLYLGTTLVYLALAVAAGSLWAMLLMVPLLWMINVGVIAREERYLERKFGDAYRSYKGRVRRWI
jgi:protein-S-isoprenylcysteine O-methyltransferase Ste14